MTPRPAHARLLPPVPPFAVLVERVRRPRIAPAGRAVPWELLRGTPRRAAREIGVTTDGVHVDGQGRVQQEVREKSPSGAPSGALLAVPVKGVRLDVLRLPALRTLPRRAPVDGRGELSAAHEMTQAQLWEVA